LAVANSVIENSRAKRNQETDAGVLANWDEWIAFSVKQRDFFASKLDEANSNLAANKAEKSKIEADMTSYCGGPSIEPAFDSNGL
jgi:hypothetical protein